MKTCDDCVEIWSHLREDESIAIEPVGILWVECHEFIE